MARTYKTRFLGLNTDLPATKLPSGTARTALNVTLKDGRLSKRSGFAEFEDDADGSSTAILNMWVAHFKAGTYVIVKVSDGGTPTPTGRFYQRKVSATAATSFTIISNTNGWTHSATEPGFGFVWNDRFITGDSGGVSQWNPSIGSGVLYKAGLPQPSAVTLVAAANGEKDGFYHCHYSYYNANLDVEGVVSAPCKAAGGPVKTRIAESNGGIAFPGAVAAPTGYEGTHCRIYTTMGNTEFLESGGVERETFSYRAAMDVQHVLASGTPGMNKSDQVLDWSNNLFTNEGGLPPPATIGCWTGGVAVYAGFTKMYVGGSTITGDGLAYSKFGRPTMVPLLITYSQTTMDSVADSRTVWPKGDHHFLPSPCDGEIIEAVAAGGTAVLYTATSTWVMRSTPDGKLYSVKRKEGFGCAGHLAAASIGFESHSMAHRAWTITTAQSFSNLSEDRFSTTLEEIPVAYQSISRMAPYSYEDEMWCAVAKTGETVARRILVLNRADGGQLVIYEPASDMWQEGEGITAMCEMAYSGATPTMLLATSKGRIFQYPDTGSDDDGNDFPAQWKGLFSTERSAYGQKLEKAEVQTGDDCSGRLRWAVTPYRADGESADADSGYVPRDNFINTLGLHNKADARFWTIELSSSAVAAGETATTWSVNDIILQLGRTG